MKDIRGSGERTLRLVMMHGGIPKLFESIDPFMTTVQTLTIALLAAAVVLSCESRTTTVGTDYLDLGHIDTARRADGTIRVLPDVRGPWLLIRSEGSDGRDTVDDRDPRTIILVTGEVRSGDYRWYDDSVRFEYGSYDVAHRLSPVSGDTVPVLRLLASRTSYDIDSVGADTLILREHADGRHRMTYIRTSEQPKNYTVDPSSIGLVGTWFLVETFDGMADHRFDTTLSERRFDPDEGRWVNNVKITYRFDRDGLCTVQTRGFDDVTEPYAIRYGRSSRAASIAMHIDAPGMHDHVIQQLTRDSLVLAKPTGTWDGTSYRLVRLL